MSDRDHIPDPKALIRHGVSVRGLATAILGDPSAAEDVAQEAYLAALRGGTVSVRDPGAWLRGVTRNLARRWIRTESRRRHREEAQPLPVAPASPEETAARLETETALTEAVRALPEPYRTVVVLRYFDGLTTAETAARTDVPEATVKTRLRRALAMLRDALDSRYGARSVWIPLLVRVIRPRDPAAAAATVGTTALVAGGVIMAKKLLIVTVVAAVLAAVVVSLVVWEGSDPIPTPNGGPEEPSVIADGSSPSTEPGGTADPASAGAHSTARASESFRVLVRYPDGSPAEKARVRLADLSGESVVEARTGALGAATLRATGERGVVHVFPLGAAPVTRDVIALAGTEIEVNLELGSVISGTLFFGEEPATGVEVHLSSMDDSVPGLIAVTDDRGGFEFSGLAPGTRFSFFAGWDVYFLDPPGEPNIHLSAPSTDLALRALLYPAIRGVVVRADGGPVGKAVVKLGYRTDEGSGGSSRVFAAEDGHFEVRLRCRGMPEALTLTATTPDGASHEVVEVNPARMREGDLDLGRIVLRASRTYEFIVHGPDGGPIAGAVILSPDGRSRVSSPTDESGRTTFEVTAATTVVLAAAAGEGVTEVRLPDEPGDPVPVTLPGGTLLTVRVRTRAGKVPINLALVIEADTKLLDVPDGMAHWLYGLAGASSPVESHVSEGESRLRFPVPRNGILRLAGIRPGVGFRLRVLDGVTDEELEARELKLGTRERRDLSVELSTEDRTLVLGVRDPDGKPVPQAYVAVRAGSGSLLATTNDAGIAVVPGIRGEKVRVTIEKPGWVPFVGELPATSVPKLVPVVLRPGRSVRLTVKNAAGAPVACEWAEAHGTDLDYRFQGYEVNEGVYLYRNLPAGKIRLSVTYAGAVQEVVVDAAETKAEITVPDTGSVVVRFEGKLAEPVLHRMRLTPTSGSSGAEVMIDVDYFPKREKWEIRLPAVLPGSYRVTLEHWADRDEDDVDHYETARKGPVIKVATGRETETALPR